jgi:hypothetical protein
MQMSKAHSKDNETAMKDADRHAEGQVSSVPLGNARSHVAQAHTKPVGDMRDIEMKEESNRKVSRADQLHGGNRNR